MSKGVTAGSFRWVAAGGDGPQHLRTAGLDESGSVWMPAAATGNQHKVLLLACWDGESCVLLDGKAFVRTSWMKKTFAADAELVRVVGVMEQKVREHFGAGP